MQAAGHFLLGSDGSIDFFANDTTEIKAANEEGIIVEVPLEYRCCITVRLLYYVPSTFDFGALGFVDQ